MGLKCSIYSQNVSIILREDPLNIFLVSQISTSWSLQHLILRLNARELNLMTVKQKYVRLCESLAIEWKIPVKTY